MVMLLGSGSRMAGSMPSAPLATALAAGALLVSTGIRTPLRAIAWLLVRAAVSIRVEGQSVPGPAVIVSNHPHVIDGVAVSVADVTMRPVARWHRIPFLRVALWIGNSVITTSGTDRPYRPAYAEALAHVQRGGRVWIAPEGGCQPERVLSPPRTGAARMAHEAGVALQVLAVEHADHPGPRLRDWRPWRRPRVVLRWGASLETTGDLTEDNHRMMTAIAEASGMTWVRRDGRVGGGFRSRRSPGSARAQ